MIKSKTRDELIEVARQLFAKTGVESTTMNDIALASKKGRRTLYTYFKSKKEIYHAVIGSELDKLYFSLKAVEKKELPADEKLLEFLYTRLEAVKDVVFRNGTLRANFFRDIWRVENVRKDFDMLEIQFVRKILDDGVKEGLFVIDDINSTAEVLHFAFKGLELPYIRGIMRGSSSNRSNKVRNTVDLFLNGIRKHDEQ